MQEFVVHTFFVDYPLQFLAGDSVTVEMHQQPNDRSCANEAIGGDHFGPVIVGIIVVTIYQILMACI